MSDELPIDIRLMRAADHLFRAANHASFADSELAGRIGECRMETLQMLKDILVNDPEYQPDDAAEPPRE